MNGGFVLKTELSIVQITDKGFGVGFYNGKKVFVDGAFLNERIKVALTGEHETYFDSEILQIIEASPDRTDDFCPHIRCGGCQFRNISYDSLLRLKASQLETTLERCSDYIDLKSLFPLSCAGSEPVFHYRNKSIYYVRRRNGISRIGMFAKMSHDLVPIDNCAMEQKWISSANSTVSQWMNEFNVEGYDETEEEGLLREIIYRTGNRTDDRMVILVVSESNIEGLNDLIARLKLLSVDSVYLNVNSSAGNGVYGDEFKLVFGKPYIVSELNSLRFKLGPRSFWQLNSSQCEKLYARILDYADLKGNETVFDLYCGVGSIGLTLAHKAGSVYGVEVIEEAVELARENAVINNISNANFFVGKSETVCQHLLAQGVSPNIIILDPPRKGCADNLLMAVTSVLPDKIIYVSCNPKSLVRDLSYIGNISDYRIKRISAFDLFPGTYHVETAVLLSRGK
jgi:23S rRNA (uracil1939-C5)-methyltransferase